MNAASTDSGIDRNTPAVALAAAEKHQHHDCR